MFGKECLVSAISQGDYGAFLALADHYMESDQLTEQELGESMLLTKEILVGSSDRMIKEELPRIFRIDLMFIFARERFDGNVNECVARLMYGAIASVRK